MSEFKAFQSVRVIGGDYKGKSGIIQESVTRNGEVVAYLVAVKNLAHRYVSPENLVDAGEPEKPKVKVGDRIRVTKKVGPHTGKEGTVKGVSTGTKDNIATVVLDRGETDPEWTDYFYFSQIEVIDPLPAFKEGDRVRILSGEGIGEIGTVEKAVFTRDGGEKWIYFVNMGGHWGRQCVEEGLELVKFLEHPEEGKEIDFDLIRKGDKIRTVREFEYGFTLTMEGVAYRQRSDGAWVTVGTKGHVVAPKDLGSLATKQTHILVERKKPEEPKDWFVFSRNTGGGPINVQTLDGRTEKDAKELAKGWNDAQKPVCGYRTVFWAAKAGK